MTEESARLAVCEAALIEAANALVEALERSGSVEDASVRVRGVGWQVGALRNTVSITMIAKPRRAW